MKMYLENSSMRGLKRQKLGFSGVSCWVWY